MINEERVAPTLLVKQIDMKPLNKSSIISITNHQPNRDKP
jgi:hypothetical protein